MLYNLGFKSGLELGSVVRSDPFVITSDSLVSISVSRGSIIVDGTNFGTETSVVPGTSIELEATSGSQFATPTFIQFYQGQELEGIFTLINRVDEVFVYNDALNGKYAFEVLPDSTWTALDDGKIGLLGDDFSYTDITPKTLDLSQSPNLRNRLHVLDYYLGHINVFDLKGNYLGRPEHSYTTPIDSATVYNQDTQGRIVTAFAFELDNTIALLNSTYSTVGTHTIDKPVGLASLQNIVYVIQRDTNIVTVLDIDTQGQVSTSRTITLSRKPYRIYTVGERVAVLTETSVEFIDSLDQVSSLLLEPFASSLAYDLESQRLFITHRQERKITRVVLDFENGHSQTTKFFANQGYLDSIVYDRFNDTIIVSDVVTKQIVTYSSSLEHQETQDLDGRHSYEMYLSAQTNTLIFSSLYPTIDARLIIGDGDPDAQDYTDLSGIQLGQTETSPSYSLTGVRDAVTLFMFPDDSDVNTLISTNGQDYTTGTTIEPGAEFKFIVGLPENKSRRIEFVLGQSVYSFNASPDNRRLIPDQLAFEPKFEATPGVTYRSETNLVQVLDQDCLVTCDEFSEIYVNGVNRGTSWTLQVGDQFSLEMTAGLEDSEIVTTEIDYAGLFKASWVINNTSLVDLEVATQDFVDVYNADLGTSVTSEPIYISSIGPSDLEVSDDYGVDLIVNDQEVGLYTVVNPGDKIQLRLDTEMFFDTEHQITVSLNNYSLTWTVYTLPNYPVMDLDFGFVDGVTLGDYVVSDIITLDTVPEDYRVSISIPRNTIPYVNGVPYNFDTEARSVNYRDVLRRDTLISIKGQDTLQLRGYALGPYGSVTQHKISSGVSTGYWQIRSVSTTGSEPTRFLYFGQTYETIKNPLACALADSPYAEVQQVSYVLPAQATSQVITGNTQTYDAPSSLVTFGADAYVDKGTQVFGKYNSSHLVLGDSIFVKRANGIKPFELERFGIKNSNPSHKVEAPSWLIHRYQDPTAPVPNFIKNSSKNHITDTPREYSLHGYNLVPVDDRIFVRQNAFSSISATILYQKDLASGTVDTDMSYGKLLAPNVVDTDLTYGKLLAPNVVDTQQEYDKVLAPNVVDTQQEYGKLLAPNVVDTQQEYDKVLAPNVVDTDLTYGKGEAPRILDTFVEYTKQLTVGILETPQFDSVEIEFSVLHGAKVLENKTVNIIVADLPATIYSLSLKTSNIEGAYSHINTVSQDRSVVIEGGYWSHPVVSNASVMYHSVDTFSYTAFHTEPVVVTSADCSQLGNEDCLTAGYFASAELAKQDAINNWDIQELTVRTSEINPGCWVWYQKLPCINSCYGCPSTGYIQGG